MMFLPYFDRSLTSPFGSLRLPEGWLHLDNLQLLQGQFAGFPPLPSELNDAWDLGPHTW